MELPGYVGAIVNYSQKRMDQLKWQRHVDRPQAGAIRTSAICCLKTKRMAVTNVEFIGISGVQKVEQTAPSLRIHFGKPKNQLRLTGAAISRFSRMTSSKKTLPVTGRSKTWVSENLDCGIEI